MPGCVRERYGKKAPFVLEILAFSPMVEILRAFDAMLATNQ
jgi:hypothetical protein